MDVETFYDEATHTLTHVVFDAETKDAVVIDPVLNYDPLRSQTSTESIETVSQFVEERGLTLHFVLETHVHADHFTGAQQLKARFDAPVAIGEGVVTVQKTFKTIIGLPADFPTDGRQFDRLLAAGEVFDAGSLSIEAIATRGHTPGCTSYRIGDAVFTGDALFIEDYGTGRCDFPGGDASDLYTSIHDVLYALPDDTRLFVGHDYCPGGRALRTFTTVGRSKRENVQLGEGTSREAFVSFRTARDKTLSPPRLLYPSLRVNLAAGELPPADESGNRYLALPLNHAQPTDDIGRARS